jgi:hypothetical protein
MISQSKKHPSITEKKIKARHHRRSKNYLKTYWPYIPILTIIGCGILIHYYWHTPTTTQTSSFSLILTNYTYYNVLESSIGIIALAIFMLRHAFAWHKVFVRGEAFVTKHPYLDILLVTIATVSLLINHNVVFI